MNRLDAYLLLRKMVQDRQVVRLCLAAEAAMEGVSPQFQGNTDTWGMCGLLHAVDHDLTRHNPRKRGEVAAEIARDEGAAVEVVETLARFRALEPEESRPAPARVLALLVPALERMLTIAQTDREWSGLDPTSLAQAMPELARDEPFLAAHGFTLEGFVETLQTSVTRYQEDVFARGQPAAAISDDFDDQNGL